MRLDVFNTEAHPFKAPPTPPDETYGTGTINAAQVPFTTVAGTPPAVSSIDRKSVV